jgi:catechol 2,3-dioxygenase
MAAARLGRKRPSPSAVTVHGQANVASRLSCQRPDSTRLGRVQLQIADLDRSCAFYEDLLGLGVLDHSDERAVLGPQEDRPLVELVERAGTRSVGPRDRLGLFHVALRLPDRSSLGRFLRHLEAEDIQYGMADHGVSEALYLRDPDGLGVEVYTDRPRSTWSRTAEGEISMTTGPLDVTSLLEAAGSAPWTEVPSGTIIGHVHLHVEALDQAAAFYHTALGFQKTMWSYPGALFFAAGDYHHHLGTNVWAGDVPVPREEDAKLLEWSVVLPAAEDVEAVAHSLKSKGFSVTREEESCLVTDSWRPSLRISTRE